MKLNYPEMGDTTADRGFDEANALFQRTVCALGDLVKRIETGEVDGSADAEATIKKIDKQLELVLQGKAAH